MAFKLPSWLKFGRGKTVNGSAPEGVPTAPTAPAPVPVQAATPAPVALSPKPVPKKPASKPAAKKATKGKK